MESEHNQDSETGPAGALADLEQKIEMDLTTDDYTDDVPRLPCVNVALRPKPLGPNVDGVRPLWHWVVPRPGVRISLTSSEDTAHLVRLTVQSESPGWQPEWVHWSYAVRHISELGGGPAVAAQDVLSADERTLDLLLLPVKTLGGPDWPMAFTSQDRRQVTLAFEAVLDEWNQPGEFDFTVVCELLDSGAVIRKPGRLRFHHPDSALLGMLPSIYNEAMRKQRAEEESFNPPFFERYLRGYEDAIEPLRDTLSRLYQYFGAYTTPSDFVPWLATWVGLTLDENWPEMKRRRLIRNAIPLYRKRGTRRGLMEYLEIYADEQPEIHDQPTVGMNLSKTTCLGSDNRLGGLAPHTFVVTLVVPDPSKINEEIVRRIIDAEKPAHTHYFLRIARRDPGNN